jgi:hypothetical protein
MRSNGTILCHHNITIGNGKITPVWNSPWLNGRKAKYIAPLIHEASSRKKWKINQALHNNAWVSKIKMDTNLTVPHIHHTSGFGYNSMEFTFMKTHRSPSHGTSRQMVNTPQLQLTMHIFLALPSHKDEEVSLEALDAPQRSNSSRDWASEIGYERRTVLRKEYGIIVVFARFVNKLKRQRHTYSLIAVSPKDFGEW